jgi:hypothetical protein
MTPEEMLEKARMWLDTAERSWEVGDTQSAALIGISYTLIATFKAVRDE